MRAAIRFALRGLRRTPGFTVLAILILALGIGSTTAMFTITRTILLKPLAYHDPARLTTLMLRIPAFEKLAAKVPVNGQHYLFWQQHNRTLEQIALVDPDGRILSGSGNPVKLQGVRITPNLFDLLGIQPHLGRGFLPQEAQEGTSRVVILSDSLWRSKFNADTSVLGRKIVLDGQPYQVVGVTPPLFPFPRGRQLADIEPLPEHTQYWVPLAFSKEELADPMGEMNFLGLMRLKPGITIAQAYSDLNALEGVISKRYSQPVEIHPLIEPLQAALAGGVRQPLIVLFSAVCLVLVIVCINLMNLMLVRSTDRRREWAIRLAIGAGLRELIRDTLFESLLLSLAGGALGAALAVWLLELVRVHAPFDLPRIDELHLDPVALGFALAVSVGSAILFGIWPAWRAAKIDPQEAIQSSSRSATGNKKGHQFGRALVAAEVALSVVLLLGAGLLIRSFVRVLQVDPGMRVQHLITAYVELPSDRYKDDKTIGQFYRRFLDGLQTLPGIEASGITSNLPLTTANNNNPMTAADRPTPPVTQWPMTNMVWSSSGYFKAAGIALKEGRIFQQSDGKERVTVISANLAARLWPGESAVGHLLKGYDPESKKKPWRVIGVVGAVHAASLTQTAANMEYFPFWQNNDQGMSVIVRTAKDPKGLAAVIRRSVAALEPQAPVSDVRTMEDVVSDSVAHRRFQLLLLVGFAGMALVLACLGIYGVLSFSVSRRTNEIGIRMALGARPGDVRRTVLRQGLVPVVFGLAAGLLASVALGNLLQSLLFDVKALDPTTYVFTSFALLGVSALACLVPSQRAARLNPVDALRQ
jgi:predicted permease